MTGHGVLLEVLDFPVVHAVEVVVGGVVLANVIDAEEIVLPVAPAPARRPVSPGDRHPFHWQQGRSSRA